MTSRARKALKIGSVCAAVVLLLGAVGLYVVQTSWFAAFVRQKIVTALEDATGARVEIAAFRFEPLGLHARVTGLVMHGTEAKTEAPLAQVRAIDLRLKLFSALTNVFDVAYLGIDTPRLHVIVNADGSTNIPGPKMKSNAKSDPLATVVNLAVGQFRLDHGLVVYGDKTFPLNARGDQLRAALDFNSLRSVYQGSVHIDALTVAARGKTPLLARVDIPVEIRRDGFSLTKARLETAASHVLINAKVNNASEPLLAVSGDANLFLPELAESLALPVATNHPTLPNRLTMNVAAQLDQQRSALAVEHLRLVLGKTTLNAAGVANHDGLKFSSEVALGELSQLLEVSTPQVGGFLTAQGTVSTDKENRYQASGSLDSRGLSVADGGMRLSNLSLSTPFHVTANRISLDALRLGLLGGSITSRVSIRDLRTIEADGQIHNIALSSLGSVLAGRTVNYGGVLSGTFAAADDAQHFLNAGTRLLITPSGRGVRVKGSLDAQYGGRDGSLNLKNVSLSLPASQLKASGTLNQLVRVRLVSRNLNDFAPLTGPLTVKLNGGTLSLDANMEGAVSDLRVAGQARVTSFVAQKRSFDELSFDFGASSHEVSVQKGSLQRNRMQVAFDGALALLKWKPVSRSKITSNLTVKNADLADLLVLAGESSDNNAGDVEADAHIGGTYGDPLGSLTAEVAKGMAMGQPFEHASLKVSLTPGLVRLDALKVEAAGGHLAADGTFQHPQERFTVGDARLHLQTNGVTLAQIAALQQADAGIQGMVTLKADMAASLHETRGQSKLDVSQVNADFVANGLRVRNQEAGSLNATARTSAGEITYNVHSNFAGSAITVDGRTKLASDYPTTAHAVIRALPVARALEMAGQSEIPVDGVLNADAALAGNLHSPEGTLGLELTNGHIYEEDVTRFSANAQYKNGIFDLQQVDALVPAGTVHLSGRYASPTEMKAGLLQMRLNSSNLDVAKLKQMQKLEPGVSGTVKVNADVDARIISAGTKSDVQLSSVNGQIAASDLTLQKRKIGNLTFSAKTNQANVSYQLNSDLAQSEIHVAGSTQLTKDYPSKAEATFKNVRYENIAPLLAKDGGSQPPFQALVEGKASLNGPLLNRNSLTASVDLSRLELTSGQRRSSQLKAVSLKNDQDIVLSFARNVFNVQRFAMRGPDTSLDVTGSAGMADSGGALNLKLAGNLDLGILQQVNRDFYSSGTITLKTAVAGTFTNPVLNGEIALKSANINYANAPNGISNANGLIQLSGNTATVKNLTAESGGGQVTVSGSASLGLGTTIFNLRARATRVRTRYANASITSSANISLNGNSERSLLSGRVTVQRIAYSSSSDIGSLLYNASTPASMAGAPSPLLSGMRLDVQITTASDLTVSSTYVEKLEVNSNLALRGTAAEPGILGHVNITDGQLVFFGNTYSVNNGSINFYDASTIRPELDFSLETLAQGVAVTLGVKGPVSNMKLSYRSDPPLTFEQIVQLLATNTTPFDPTIAAHQPTAPQQSLSQMGESQVLGQAVADPLASRLKRVFGLSQFKIDPSIAGNNGQPTAKVTLSQKVTNAVTFTYITDVTQTNSQIARVQWDLSSNTSAVALRDYNGNVSVQLFHKFQVR